MDNKNVSFEDEIKNMTLEEKARFIENVLSETSVNWVQILRFAQAIGSGFATMALANDELIKILVSKKIMTTGEANATRYIDNDVFPKHVEKFLDAFIHAIVGDKQ